MTRRAAAATTASSSGSRSSASGRRTRTERPEKAAGKPAGSGRTSRATSKRASKAGPDATSAAPDVTATSEVAPRRTRAKRGQGDQLREQILDATYELLMETGSVDKVSTRAVAHRVGCSSPALYLHFPDKASLLWATCERQFLRLSVLIEAAIDGVDDPFEALLAIGRAYVNFGIEHAEEYRVMMMIPGTAIWNPPMEDLPGEAGFDILHDLLEQAMADGLIREDDPTMLALTVWAAVHGIVALRVAKPAFEWPPVDDQIDQMLAVLMVGLAVPATGRNEARSARRRSRSRSSADR
jgi:AcrR family transcriptional regulator